MFSFCSGTIFQIEGGRTYVSAISNVDLVISFELQYCESCSRQTANPLSNNNDDDLLYACASLS